MSLPEPGRETAPSRVVSATTFETSPLPPGSNLPNLVAPVLEAAAKRVKVFSSSSNRASDLGHDCARFLWYSRTRGSEALAHSVELQMVFEEGALQEKAILNALSEAGFQLIEQQRGLEWPEYRITGHVDCVVVVGDRGVPLDAKSMSPHIFQKLFSGGSGVYEWSDISPRLESFPWVRKYRAQIMIYSLLKNIDIGILFFKNKSTGQIAQVNVPLDFQYGEELLQKAELVNRHCEDSSSEGPERLSGRVAVQNCEECRFRHLCLPGLEGGDTIVLLEDEEVENLLDRRGALEESGREYGRLDDEAKRWAKARPEPQLAMGHWLVTKKGTTRVVTTIERIPGA